MTKGFSLAALAIVFAAATAAAASGPFGIFRSRCGPGGCRACQQAEPEFLPAAAQHAGGGPAPAGPLEPWQTSGVVREQLHDEPTYTVNGKRLTPWEAIGQLLEDDSAKLWLVIAGEGRERVGKDLADPKYAEFMSRTRVWSVPADHFSLMDRKTGKPVFRNAGNPSITLMTGSGDVLLEKDGYAGPKDLDLLREADPEFKRPILPKKPEPGPQPAPRPDDKNPPAPPPASPMFPLCCVGAAAIAAIYLRGKK